VREDEEEPPPPVEDPAGQQVTAAAITGREGGTHENSESIRRFEEILREEARGMLTGYLRDGTEYLSASTVRRVVQVASMSVVGSAIAVSRLDREVRRVTTTYPEEDPITLADHMVRMCEQEVLDWMRTNTVHPGPDADPDPAGSLTGQELVDDLERALAEEEAERYPPPGSREDAWMMKVLKQATKVHCFAEEICNQTMKEDWQPCANQLYRWQMDQEVSHLYALFGGPEEDEVRVKGQKLAKVWMERAMDSIERDCDFRGGSNSTGRDNATMMGRPWRAGPVRFRRRPPLDELTVPGGRGPGVSKSSAADRLAVQASQAGSRRQWRIRMAVPSFPQALQTSRAIRTASSPATLTPRAQRGTSGLQELKRGSSDRWRPDQ
jgi:hypothetical protein